MIYRRYKAVSYLFFFVKMNELHKTKCFSIDKSQKLNTERKKQVAEFSTIWSNMIINFIKFENMQNNNNSTYCLTVKIHVAVELHPAWEGWTLGFMGIVTS